MTRLTPAQLELVRHRPQRTELKLSIFQPQIIFQAKINDPAIGRDALVIPYDSVSLGSYTAIESGFTLWVGSTAGGNDIGKIRIRSATSTTLTVSENSNILWADNLFLTVFYYVELWPIFPRIIADPSNDENVIFYKDYNIAYSNQNSVLGTFINMGPHRAADLDPASGQTQIYYSASGSYNMRGSTLNYYWWFQGACNVTGSNSKTPGYINYCTPGQYVTRLIISGSNGESDVSYRYVSINNSIQRWELENLNGSRDENGYTASFKVFEIVPIQQNAVVVLYGNNYYGNVLSNLGGNAPNAGDIFFVGYVDKDSIRYDYEHSEVSFDAVSITELMKKSSGFSVSVASKANPAYWYELLDMDSRRAIYHYLRWHTTALMFNDLEYVGNDYKIQFFDSDRESMFDAIDNYMRETMLGKVVSDRQGKLWVEVDGMAYSNPTGSFSPPVMDITNRDWRNTPEITERLNPEVSYAEYGGVAYSGNSTGTFDAFIGAAPGGTPGFYGGIDNHEGLALLNQGQLNRLVGNVFANKNTPFPEIKTDLGINAGNIDIAPQEALGLHIAREDTVRNLRIDGLYLPDSMTWKYDPNGQILLPDLTSKQLVSGIPGETVIIPPPKDIGNGWNVPTFKIPPFPPLGPPIGPTVLTSIARIILHDRDNTVTKQGLLLSEDFDTISPTYTPINTTLTEAQWTSISQVVVTPSGAIYVARLGSSSDAFISYAPYPGAAFSTVVNQMVLEDLFGPGTALIQFMACRPDLPEEVIFYAGCGAGFGFFFGQGTTFTQAPALAGLSTFGLGIPTFGGDTPLWLAQHGAGGSVETWQPDYTDPQAVPIGAGFNNTHVRAGTSGNTIHVVDSGGMSLVLGANNCNSTIPVTPGGIAIDFHADTPLGIYKFGCDESGQYLFTRGTTVPIRSIDNGYTFAQITGLDASGFWLFRGRGSLGGSQWVASCNPLAGTQIRYNEDGGQGTWDDKTGNLLTLNPNADINVIEILG